MRGMVLLIVGLVLAGCSAPPQTAPTTTDPAPAEPVAYDGILLSGCTRSTGLFPLPKQQAQALLPPDYTATDLLDGVATTPLGAITVELVDCAGGRDETRTALFFLGVWAEPPAMVASLTVGYDVVLLGSVHAQDSTAALFTRWNLTPVERAPLDAAPLEAAGVTRTAVGAGGVELAVATASQPGTDLGLPVRFYSVVEGKTVGFVDLRPAGPGARDNGAATLTGSSFLGRDLPALGPGLGTILQFGSLSFGYEPVDLP